MSTIALNRKSKLDKGFTVNTNPLVHAGLLTDKPVNGDEFLLTFKIRGDKRSITQLVRATRNGSTLYSNFIPKGLTTPTVGRPTSVEFVNIELI